MQSNLSNRGKQLIKAAQTNDTKVLIRLLDEGIVDINEQDDGSVLGQDYIGHSALLAAAHWGSVQSVEILLSYGADVRVKNMHNQNVLFLAAWQAARETKCYDIIRLIAKHLSSHNKRAFNDLLYQQDNFNQSAAKIIERHDNGAHLNELLEYSERQINKAQAKKSEKNKRLIPTIYHQNLEPGDSHNLEMRLATSAGLITLGTYTFIFSLAMTLTDKEAAIKIACLGVFLVSAGAFVAGHETWLCYSPYWQSVS